MPRVSVADLPVYNKPTFPSPSKPILSPSGTCQSSASSRKANEAVTTDISSSTQETEPPPDKTQTSEIDCSPQTTDQPTVQTADVSI